MKFKTLSLIGMSGVSVLSSLIIVSNSQHTLFSRANNLEYTLTINKNNAPAFGEGQFSVKTANGNTIWFEYKNFGLLNGTIALKSHGYLKNLTPLSSINKFYYTQGGTALSSYIDGSADVIGVWEDGCKASNIEYQIQDDHIDGIACSWTPEYFKPINYFCWADPLWASGILWLKANEIVINYSC